MRAGQQLRDHRVATPITIQVVRGAGTITVSDAVYPAQSGTFVSLGADVVHGAAAETDLVLLVHRAAVAEERGATMIGGLMTDRANDRHSRTLLRQAVALGLLAPERAHGLGVIDAGELAETRAP